MIENFKSPCDLNSYSPLKNMIGLLDFGLSSVSDSLRDKRSRNCRESCREHRSYFEQKMEIIHFSQEVGVFIIKPRKSIRC